jgi:trimethylamine--corrinoid protein Co-methyltransferase
MKLELLEPGQKDAIHQASLDILENAGATFLTPRAQETFERAGAAVNRKTGNVKIPVSLVKETLQKCPSEFRLYGRNSKHDLILGGKNQYMTCGGEYPYILDLESGARRPAILDDLRSITTVTDALENISVGGSYMIAPSDLPEEYRHIERGALHYKYTTKTTHWDTEGYIGNSGELGSTHNLELASIVAGSEDELRKKPIGTASICPSSPLIFDVGLTDDAINFAKHGVPILIEPMDNTGATSPNTLAGSLVQTNATVLAGIALIQLVNPGNPIVYGSIPVSLELRTGIAAAGCPETAIRCAGGAQMASHYGVPSAMSGGVSDSKIPDVQAGYESALGLLTTVLAGANWTRVVAGALEYHFTASYEMLVIHNEMFGMALRIAHGMDINEDTMATSLIKTIAPLGGHYMAERHTIDHIPTERYLPTISDKRTRGDWEKAGSKTLAETAKERAKEILATHRPDPPLPKDVEKQLDATRLQIEKRLARTKTSSSQN